VALALHGEQYLLPGLLFLATVTAAVLLGAAWLINWWLKGRREAPPSLLRLEDYETSEKRDVHDQRGGGAV
jgi:hypothetical protein